MVSLIARAKTIAFQGEPGAYANLAAREAVPHAQALPRPTFDAALEAVRQGEADLAIVPVENSVYGRIADTHLLVRHFGRPVKAQAFMTLPSVVTSSWLSKWRTMKSSRLAASNGLKRKPS